MRRISSSRCPALKLADTLFPTYGFLLQSALWVCYEYFLKSSGFLAYSYGNIGYSQYPFIPFIQIADALGIWGVSLMVVYPSALIGNAFSRGLKHFKEAWRSWLGPAAGYIALFAAVVLYGVFTQVDTSTLPAVESRPRPAERGPVERTDTTRTANPSMFCSGRAARPWRRTRRS